MCLMQLQDDLKEKRGYCKLKEEALDRTLWAIRFIRGYGPVVKTDSGMNVCNAVSICTCLSHSFPTLTSKTGVIVCALYLFCEHSASNQLLSINIPEV